MNGTELSARDQQSLNASQISSVMGSITNPQGKPYVTVDTLSIELKSAASCTTMALSRVIQTSDKQAVQTAIQSTIVKSITGKGMLCKLNMLDMLAELFDNSLYLCN